MTETLLNVGLIVAAIVALLAFVSAPKTVLWLACSFAGAYLGTQETHSLVGTAVGLAAGCGVGLLIAGGWAIGETAVEKLRAARRRVKSLEQTSDEKPISVEESDRAARLFFLLIGVLLVAVPLALLVMDKLGL